MAEKKGKNRKKAIMQTLNQINQDCGHFANQADHCARTFIISSSVLIPLISGMMLLIGNRNIPLNVALLPALLGCLVALFCAIRVRMFNIFWHRELPEPYIEGEINPIYLGTMRNISLSEYKQKLFGHLPSAGGQMKKDAEEQYHMLLKAGRKYQMLMACIIAFASGQALSVSIILLRTFLP